MSTHEYPTFQIRKLIPSDEYREYREHRKYPKYRKYATSLLVHRPFFRHQTGRKGEWQRPVPGAAATHRGRRRVHTLPMSHGSTALPARPAPRARGGRTWRIRGKRLEMTVGAAGGPTQELIR